MKINNITETMASVIKDTILGEWKHDGRIDNVFRDCIQTEIDDKHYVITIECMEETGTAINHEGVINHEAAEECTLKHLDD